VTIAPQESCVCADSCALRAAITDAAVVDKTLLARCCRQCVTELFLAGKAGWLFLLDTNTVRIVA
jgi:hypothetical protein